MCPPFFGTPVLHEPSAAIDCRPCAIYTLVGARSDLRPDQPPRLLCLTVDKELWTDEGISWRQKHYLYNSGGGYNAGRLACWERGTLCVRVGVDSGQGHARLLHLHRVHL